MRLATRAEIRALEDEAIQAGAYPSAALMETAGRSAARAILKRYLDGATRVRVACGRGNNGGDGFVIARYLREAGLDVRLQLVGLVNELKGDPVAYAQLYRWIGGEIEECADGDLGAARAGELQVDALLGTGLDRPVEGSYAAAVEALNAAARQGASVYAVDIPSGLDADTGRPLGEAVHALATGTFGLGKPGLYVTPGMEYAGRVEVFDIGFPERSCAKWAVTARYLEPGERILRLAPRHVASHKGSFGHVLACAGSPGKSGAAELACRGAVRAGAGLVTLCAPAGVRAAWPEVMHEPVAQFSAATWRPELLHRKTAVVFGPGVGTGVEEGKFFAELASTHLPLVVDADGLNLLAKDPSLLNDRAGPTVLTPHPAEAARLLGIDTEGVQEHRISSALDLAHKFHALVVLKGARSLIALPEGRYWINGSGSPALAAGGMGDVLAGTLAGLMAGGLQPEQAACVATFVHGKAGEAAYGAGGLRASEVADRLPAELAALVGR